MTVPGTVGNPLYVKDDTTSGPLLVDSNPASYSVQTRNGSGDPLTFTENGHTYTVTYFGLNIDTITRNT